MRRARTGPRAPGRLRKSLTPLNALSLEGSVGCGARKGPRARGRLRKSLTPLNALSLEGSVGCGACEKVPELRRRLRKSLTVCWMRRAWRARKGPRAPGRIRKSLMPLNALSLEGSVGCGAREKVPELRGRLRKSLTPLNVLSLEGSVGCGACEKVPELGGGSGRVATKRVLSGRFWKALLDAAREKVPELRGRLRI